MLKILRLTLLVLTLVFITEKLVAQITTIADFVTATEYSNGNQDNIYIFCANKNEKKASLTASFAANELGTFEWQKYNILTSRFEFFQNDLAGNQTSTILNLENGCYRAILKTATSEKIYTSWVFNYYFDIKAEIPESDCISFLLKGSVDAEKIEYVDLTNGQVKEILQHIQVKWMIGNVVINRFATSRVFDPPTKDTEYTFEVNNRFGCVKQAKVLYKSIVTKAKFVVDKDKGEAPLDVTFTNESENGDPGKFEWFIFRDLDEIKREALQNKGVVKDSILTKLYNDSPVFVFENSGSYKVKLVSKKVSEFLTCYDTVYLEGYIIADTSFVDAPNVFTPNGDGVNDEFIIKFWSMKEIKISIFNRWGKLLHVWQNNNVLGFGNTIETVAQSVWDGKIGGKYATPGVYYYVVDGIGRDGKRRRANGFFHLFRDK